MQEQSIKYLGKFMNPFQILWAKRERRKRIRNPWRQLREMNPLLCQGYTSGWKNIVLEYCTSSKVFSLKSAGSTSNCPTCFISPFSSNCHLGSPKLLGNETGWGSGCSLPGAVRHLQHSCLEAIFPHSWKRTTRRNNLVLLDNGRLIGLNSLMVCECAVQYNRSWRKLYCKLANSYFAFRGLLRSFLVVCSSRITREQLVYSI